MSEWEEIFGEGVSAESVIADINASCDQADKASVKDRAQEEKRQRLMNATAYRGDESAKQSLLRELRNNTTEEFRYRERRNLAAFLRLPDGDFSYLADEYRIPVGLAELISTIFYWRYQGCHNEQDYRRAVDWLIGCFVAINPGMDLRFVVAQFEAATAATGMSVLMADKDQKLTDSARPAFDILCVRARGVLPPKAMVDSAITALELALGGRLSDTYGFEPFNELGRARGALVTMAFALAGESIEAATVAAETDFAPFIYGDISKFDFWDLHASNVLELLRNAPATRVKIIDLNKTHEYLSGLGA